MKSVKEATGNIKDTRRDKERDNKPGKLKRLPSMNTTDRYDSHSYKQSCSQLEARARHTHSKLLESTMKTFELMLHD